MFCVPVCRFTDSVIELIAAACACVCVFSLSTHKHALKKYRFFPLHLSSVCALSLTDKQSQFSRCCWLSDHHHLRSAPVSLQCNLINLATQQHSVAGGGNGFGSFPLLFYCCVAVLSCWSLREVVVSLDDDRRTYERAAAASALFSAVVSLSSSSSFW